MSDHVDAPPELMDRSDCRPIAGRLHPSTIINIYDGPKGLSLIAQLHVATDDQMAAAQESLAILRPLFSRDA